MSASRASPFFRRHQDAALLPLLAFACVLLSCPSHLLSAPAPSRRPTVTHSPLQPKSGESVQVIADFHDVPSPAPLEFQYQIVDPGQYISLTDREYQTRWINLPFTQVAAPSPSNSPNPSVNRLTIVLPPELQKHRRLIRYRFWSARDQKLAAPTETDEQPNYAYFVYDGVPPWRGAINPNSSSRSQREPKLFSPDILQRVPVYHFISHKSSVEQVTWDRPHSFGSRSRNQYHHTGTMVYDGIVYDHVKFRARGGVWRHSMGKNMWKFNFVSGHRFRARDAYGHFYKAKWDKLNLGACIQQGDYGMRGEQGLFEAVGFRLFNLAGIEAPNTHWVHLRIITELDENPPDQYAGDFWGLYLATENIDEQFLKEHQLPPGNVYKIENFRGKLEFNGNPQITNHSDINEFMRAISRHHPPSWWISNVDLSRYYNYRSILECIHHYDIDSGKNYFHYFNPNSGKWIVLPWDIDLSWGERMYGGGYEPFYRAGLLATAPFKSEYQQRLAEIRDLLFNPEQMNRLIDEHAAMISDPAGGLSLADADRAKWDFHPVLASHRSDSSKAGHGRFYFGKTSNRFKTMVDYMKDYVTRRTDYIDRRLLGDFRPPTRPSLQRANDSEFQITPATGSDQPEILFRWRLAAVTDPASPSFNPRKPWLYEITPVWSEISTQPSISLPKVKLVKGQTYRVRVQRQDSAGNWSRWSEPIEFTADN